MTKPYDALEGRSPEARSRDQADALKAQLRRAAGLTGYGSSQVADAEALAELPVLRKSDLSALQKAEPPFGGLTEGGFAYRFQSPGPIYEPGRRGGDWWRLGRFLHAAGIKALKLKLISVPFWRMQTLFEKSRNTSQP